MTLFSLALEIITQAQDQKKTITTAESITGGRIASALTAVSGASAVFMGGVVAYSEHAKIHSAGVPVEEVRRTHGYSEATAKYMAERVRRRNIADISISSTGCAGPEEIYGFQAGEVIFGLSVRGQETKTFREIFTGMREEVQEQATKFALEKVLEALEMGE
ncbi:MAG: CinA family protein [Candidatus Peregrinibacteria bacterium]